MRGLCVYTATYSPPAAAAVAYSCCCCCCCCCWCRNEPTAADTACECFPALIRKLPFYKADLQSGISPLPACKFIFIDSLGFEEQRGTWGPVRKRCGNCVACDSLSVRISANWLNLKNLRREFTASSGRSACMARQWHGSSHRLKGNN